MSGERGELVHRGSGEPGWTRGRGLAPGAPEAGRRLLCPAPQASAGLVPRRPPRSPTPGGPERSCPTPASEWLPGPQCHPRRGTGGGRRCLSWPLSNRPCGLEHTLVSWGLWGSSADRGYSQQMSGRWGLSQSTIEPQCQGPLRVTCRASSLPSRSSCSSPEGRGRIHRKADTKADRQTRTWRTRSGGCGGAAGPPKRAEST